MTIKTALTGPAPVTQVRESVVALLEYLGKPAEPLPQVIHLKDMVLELSSKRYVYYAVTSGTCSCPSSTYRPGKPCKHQRKYFSGPEKSQVEIERESDEELASLHKAKWAGGFNGPTDSDTIKSKAEAPTSNLTNIIDAYAPLTTEEEIRYWHKKQVQEA
jgi:hypothetical protein